jgi:hypothetical protein
MPTLKLTQASPQPQSHIEGIDAERRPEVSSPTR